MNNTIQRAIMAEAEESFDRNVTPTSVGRLPEEILAVCRKCYCLGFINGGDHVLSQVQQVQYS